jgi:hypothetical protein
MKILVVLQIIEALCSTLSLRLQIVINGNIVVFTAYANSTDRVSKNVRVHIKVLISELSVLPTSVTMWGEVLGIYSLFSERVNWAKLFYSIDNGVNWKTVGMYPCGSDSNWYFGIVPHQIMGKVEASYKTLRTYG